MSELLPEPATTVTTVRTPVGISTLTFSRLLALALVMDSLPFAARQLDLIGIDCLIWRPVRGSAFRRFAKMPSHNVVPARGPRNCPRRRLSRHEFRRMARDQPRDRRL